GADSREKPSDERPARQKYRDGPREDERKKHGDREERDQAADGGRIVARRDALGACRLDRHVAILARGAAKRTTEWTRMSTPGGSAALIRAVEVIEKTRDGKATLAVAPLVAACGAPVAKMSGRGLGFSGGTLDKLESIKGYRVDLTTAEFLAQLGRIGIVITGQTADLAPADGKMYALRDA